MLHYADKDLQQQMLAMSPLEFQQLMLDFLGYLGVQEVKINRYRKDGGFYAEGEIIAGVFHFFLGIRVHRQSKNIHGPAMSEFIGGQLNNRYTQGIFITTSNFSQSALDWASATIPKVYTFSGEQIEMIMRDYKVEM